MITILIVVIFVVGFLLACRTLSRDAQKIHGILDHIMAEASATKDINELYALHTKLVQFATKECWGHHFGSHAKEVSIYIATKIECLVNNEKQS